MMSLHTRAKFNGSLIKKEAIYRIARHTHSGFPRYSCISKLHKNSEFARATRHQTNFSGVVWVIH